MLPVPNSSSPLPVNRTSVDKAMSLLAAFEMDPEAGVGVSELARRTGMSKSTAFRILEMLERNCAVAKSGHLYFLGARMYGLGQRARSHEDLRLAEVLTPYLIEVYEATHLTLHAAVLHNADIVYLNKLHGRHRGVAVPSRIGGRLPACTTAVGKAMLAFDPLFEGRDGMLRVELSGVRREGVAYDHGQTAMGLVCLGAPILDAGGKAVAAFSVSGPAGSVVPALHAGPLRRACFRAARAVAAMRCQSRSNSSSSEPASAIPSMRPSMV